MKKALLLYSLILVALFGEALFTSKILSQADVAFLFAPWRARRPAAWTRPANPLLMDQSEQVYPNLYYARNAIRRGHIPLWNPHILAGMTFIGNMQSAMFFPLTWIAYVLNPLDAIEWISFLKLLMAATGTFAFCFYALRTSWLGSFVAGTIYMLASFNTAWTFYAMGTASAWVPWVFLATHHLFVRSQWTDCLLLAIAFALLLFAGHPETAFYTAIGLAVYGGYLFFLPETRSRRIRIVLLGATAVVLGIALSAIQVLPFLEALKHSLLQQERKWIEGASMPLTAAVTYLIPNFYGNPADGFYHGVGNWNNCTGFAGVVTLFSATVSSYFSRFRKGVLVWTLLSAWCLMMIFSIPPVSWIFFRLPLFKASLNMLLLFLYQFSAAVLAAFGLDMMRELSEIQFRRVQNATLWSGIFLMIVLTPLVAAGTVKFFDPHSQDRGMLIYFVRQVVFFYFTVGIILFLMRPINRDASSRQRIVRLLSGLLFCELFFLCAYGYNPIIPRDWAFGSEPNSVTFLRDRSPDRFTSVERWILFQNISQMYRIYDARGYDYPPPESYTRFFRNTMDPDPLNVWFHIWQWDLKKINAARIAGIRYYLAEGVLTYPGFRLVYDRELNIYEDTRTLPRAYLTGNVRKAPGAKELLEALRTAPSDSYPAFNDRIAIDSPEQSAASIVRYDAEYVRIQAQPQYPALLVLTDTFFPGWKALVDDKETEIIQTNLAFRGVALSPGRHIVEFVYQPWSFQIGKYLSFAAWAGVAAVLTAAKVKRRFRN
ncbi:MAG TPA: YfhO family protein [Acidobacteriota bacterium]|jgi:hypothetical protein|nr:YfhO family protein [Acidobacteriota bacterium]